MAVDNSWAYDLGAQIYSVAKGLLLTKLKKIYPNVYITDKSKSIGTPKFPTVYIHELPGTEKGRDLEGTSINGVLVTMQVDVTTNSDNSEVRKVMATVSDVFKRMGFEAVSILDIDDTGETIRGVARFRREIDKKDWLL